MLKHGKISKRKIKVSYLVQTSWSGNGRIFCRTVVAIRSPIIGTMVIYCSCKGFLFVEQKAISASFVGQGSVGAFEKSIAGSGVRVQLKAKRFRTTAFLHKRKIELLGYKGFWPSLCGNGKNYKGFFTAWKKNSHITLSSSREMLRFLTAIEIRGT